MLLAFAHEPCPCVGESRQRLLVQAVEPVAVEPDGDARAWRIAGKDARYWLWGSEVDEDLSEQDAHHMVRALKADLLVCVERVVRGVEPIEPGRPRDVGAEGAPTTDGLRPRHLVAGKEQDRAFVGVHDLQQQTTLHVTSVCDPTLKALAAPAAGSVGGKRSSLRPHQARQVVLADGVVQVRVLRQALMEVIGAKGLMHLCPPFVRWPICRASSSA